ncbi:MAG: toxin-antitoxin system HicB family antitoxin [Pseudomonadota bacterium]
MVTRQRPPLPTPRLPLSRQAAAKALGRDVPGPGSLGQWRQRVPRSLHEKLKFVAAREGVSLNAYVAGVLAESVGRAG